MGHIPLSAFPFSLHGIESINVKMQTVADEINIDVEQQPTTIQTDADSGGNGNGLKYLPKWPPVNIDFQDVTYSVPDLTGKIDDCD